MVNYLISSCSWEASGSFSADSTSLGLGHFLNDDLLDLHVGDIIIGDDLLLDLLDELGPGDFFPLGRGLVDVSGICLQKALEHRIVGNQVGEQLDLVFLVEFQGGVPLLDGVAHLVIALQKLPEPIAHPVVRILHDGVGSLDGASHLGAALHDAAEGAGAQGHDHPAHPVDAHKDGHVVAVVFREALGILDLHFQLVLDLLVSVVHLAVHAQGVAGLVAGGPEDHVGALIDEGDEPLDQVINKPVFVQVIGFLYGHVQHTGGLNVPVLAAGDELGVHAQVPDAVGGDLPGQGHGHHLFIAGDEPAGMLDDPVQGIQAVLDDPQPTLVHLLVRDGVVLL